MKHDSSEARNPQSPTEPEHEPSERTTHEQVLIVGKLAVLLGVLIAVGLSGAYMGMRLAVGGSEVEVPSIIGQPLETATEILEQVNLQREVVGERFDSEALRGVVLSQAPLAGGTIKAQRKVQVILSLGAKNSPVPDLRGAPLRVARLLASQAGFEVGNISEVSMGEFPKGQIVQQYPPPNSKELLSPMIDVLVSDGTVSRYVMPDITNQSLNTVLLFFEKNGFKLGEIQYRDSATVSRGAVVKQFPEPGYMLTDGDTINLEIAR